MEKRRNCSPQEQFLLFSTIFYNLILDFCVITRTRFFLRDKRLFEITEVEITRVDCIFLPYVPFLFGLTHFASRLRLKSCLSSLLSPQIRPILRLFEAGISLPKIILLKISTDQGLVVQSIFSLTSSLRCQLVKCFMTFITKYIDIFR